MRQKPKKTCRFHLKDANFSIQGILVDETKSVYVVHCPKVVTSPTQTAELDEGHVRIPKSNVHFFQVIGGE